MRRIGRGSRHAVGRSVLHFTRLSESRSRQRPSNYQVEGDDKRQNLPEHCSGHDFQDYHIGSRLQTLRLSSIFMNHDSAKPLHHLRKHLIRVTAAPRRYLIQRFTLASSSALALTQASLSPRRSSFQNGARVLR